MNILFHHMPKTGGLSIKKLLKDNEKAFTKLLFAHHNKISYDDFCEFYKFCFVRHPIDRFLSCWNYYVMGISIKIKNKDKLVGEWLLYKWKDINNFIQNEDFQYVFQISCHFNPLSNYIDKDKYNFIGRYESYNLDLESVLNFIGLNNYKIPYVNRSQDFGNFRTIEDLTEDSINKLYEIYKVDFEKFGYTI